MREALLARLGDFDKLLERLRRAGSLREAGNVRRRAEADVLREFPLAGRVPGWFFRVREPRPGRYVGEGMDLWGRQVLKFGSDEASVLQGCIEAAREIEESLGPE